MAAGGGIEKGYIAVVGMGRDESGHVKVRVGWVRSELAFAVEDGVGVAETASGVDTRRLAFDCHV